MGVLQQSNQNKLEYTTNAQKFMRQLFSMNEEFPMPKTKAKKKKGEKPIYNTVRQWTFIGTKRYMESVATMSTLFAKMNYYIEEKKKTRSHDVIYFTPNGYYMRKRLTEMLRGLNAFVLDFDKHTAWYDVLQVIEDAGLPMPTLINKTNKGLHIYFVFKESVRATAKSIKLYDAIHKHMIEEVGADLSATGANRIYRLPTDETIVYYEPSHVYDFDVFKDWRDINFPFEPYQQVVRLYNEDSTDIMHHPAIQKLLTTPVYIGKRDETLFTLVLACKYSKMDLEQTTETIMKWFYSYCQTDGQFHELYVLKKTDYFYHSKYVRPSQAKVQDLSGMDFKYSDFNSHYYTPAKKREERLRTHLTEWKDDLISLLEHKKGFICGTQKELAAKLAMPLITFKVILRDLKTEGKILVDSTKGRNGKTSIILVEHKHIQEVQAEPKVINLGLAAAEEVEMLEVAATVELTEVREPSTALIIAFPNTRRIKPSKRKKNARKGNIVPFVLRSHPPPT